MASGGAPPASPWPGKPTRAILAAGLGSAPERTPHEPPNGSRSARPAACAPSRQQRPVHRDKAEPPGSKGADHLCTCCRSLSRAPDDDSLALDLLSAPVLLRRWYRSLASGCTGREDDTEGGELSFSKGHGGGVWRCRETDRPRREDRGCVR